MQMDYGEIAVSYRTAKSKLGQIKILSELNSCSTDEIKAILIYKGEDVPGRRSNMTNEILEQMHKNKGKYDISILTAEPAKIVEKVDKIVEKPDTCPVPVDDNDESEIENTVEDVPDPAATKDEALSIVLELVGDELDNIRHRIEFHDETIEELKAKAKLLEEWISCSTSTKAM